MGGNSLNTIIFAAIVGFSLLLQRCVKQAPRLLYKLVSGYGIATTLDFAFLAVVDLSTWVTYSADE